MTLSEQQCSGRYESSTLYWQVYKCLRRHLVELDFLIQQSHKLSTPLANWSNQTSNVTTWNKASESFVTMRVPYQEPMEPTAEHVQSSNKDNKTKGCSCKRCPSTSTLSSDSSSDSSNTSYNYSTSNNQNASTTSNSSNNSWIKRSKITLSTIDNSSIKRCTLHNSTLTSVQSAKWTKLTDSEVANIKTLKTSSIESSNIHDVEFIRRAVVKDSTIQDCVKLKRCNIRASVLTGGTMVDRGATLDNCIVSNCVIIRTSFQGMVLENGIWKNGSLIGRVDKSKEVIIRAMNEVLATLSECIFQILFHWCTSWQRGSQKNAEFSASKADAKLSATIDEADATNPESGSLAEKRSISQSDDKPVPKHEEAKGSYSGAEEPLPLYKSWYTRYSRWWLVRHADM